MKFGDAINEVTSRQKKAWRRSWHGVQLGKEMYIVWFAVGAHGKSTIYNDLIEKIKPCIALVVDGVIQPGWLASQPDMLSEDWEVGE